MNQMPIGDPLAKALAAILLPVFLLALSPILLPLMFYRLLTKDD